MRGRVAFARDTAVARCFSWRRSRARWASSAVTRDGEAMRRLSTWASLRGRGGILPAAGGAAQRYVIPKTLIKTTLAAQSPLGAGQGGGSVKQQGLPRPFVDKAVALSTTVLVRYAAIRGPDDDTHPPLRQGSRAGGRRRHARPLLARRLLAHLARGARARGARVRGRGPPGRRGQRRAQHRGAG